MSGVRSQEGHLIVSWFGQVRVWLFKALQADLCSFCFSLFSGRTSLCCHCTKEAWMLVAHRVNDTHWVYCVILAIPKEEASCWTILQDMTTSTIVFTEETPLLLFSKVYRFATKETRNRSFWESLWIGWWGNKSWSWYIPVAVSIISCKKCRKVGTSRNYS